MRTVALSVAMALAATPALAEVRCWPIKVAGKHVHIGHKASAHKPKPKVAPNPYRVRVIKIARPRIRAHSDRWELACEVPGPITYDTYIIVPVLADLAAPKMMSMAPVDERPARLAGPVWFPEGALSGGAGDGFIIGPNPGGTDPVDPPGPGPDPGGPGPGPDPGNPGPDPGEPGPDPGGPGPGPDPGGPIPPWEPPVQPPLDPPTAVPEPSTWAMMILGFGAIGAAIRRRHRRGIA